MNLHWTAILRKEFQLLKLYRSYFTSLAYLSAKKPVDFLFLRNKSFSKMSTQASLLESSLLNLFSSSIVSPLLPIAGVKPNLIHKGVAGRILVVGGSNEYAGAPYFSAQSAFRAGADLVYVLCYKSTANVIKGYSPDLIVLGCLDDGSSFEAAVNEWLPRAHAVVLGPGLGRDSFLQSRVQLLIENVRQRELPLVVDADGLYWVTQQASLVRGYAHCVLTPNAIELARLAHSLKLSDSANFPDTEEKRRRLTVQVARDLRCLIVCKGYQDFITDGVHLVECTAADSMRRCGGQGDILSGVMGTFAFWARRAPQVGASELREALVADADAASQQQPTASAAAFAGALAACTLTRTANRLAFAQRGRATLTSDMLALLPDAVRELLPLAVDGTHTAAR